MLSKDELVDLLHNNDMKIVFTKADGSERTMICTLRSDAIVQYEKKTDKERTVVPNPDAVTVWDLEAEGFRRVTISKIISYEVHS